MNGGHTTVWEDGALVEAIQMRFNGFVGNTFDIYYCTTPERRDRVKLGAQQRNSRNHGHRKGAEQLQGLSLGAKVWKALPTIMEKPLEAAFPDGIQVVDGAVAYSSGNGVPFTGWPGMTGTATTL